MARHETAAVRLSTRPVTHSSPLAASSAQPQQKHCVQPPWHTTDSHWRGLGRGSHRPISVICAVRLHDTCAPTALRCNEVVNARASVLPFVQPLYLSLISVFARIRPRQLLCCATLNDSLMPLYLEIGHDKDFKGMHVRLTIQTTAALQKSNLSLVLAMPGALAGCNAGIWAGR